MSVMCMCQDIHRNFVLEPKTSAGCMFALTLSLWLGFLCCVICTTQLLPVCSKHCSDFPVKRQSLQARSNETLFFSSRCFVFVYFLFFPNEVACTNVQPTTSCMISHLFDHIIRDLFQREQCVTALIVLATGGSVLVSRF